MNKFLKVCESVTKFIVGEPDEGLYPWHNEKPKPKRKYRRRTKKTK